MTHKSSFVLGVEGGGSLTPGCVGYNYAPLTLPVPVLVILCCRNEKYTQALAAAEKPLILYGSAVLERDDSASIVSVLKSLNAQTKVQQTRTK